MMNVDCIIFFNLNCHCIEKCVDKFEVEAEIATTDDLEYLISTFQKLMPSLSSYIFQNFITTKM